MKKCTVFLLAMVLALCSVAYAYEIDLSALTVEELISLHNDVQAQIQKAFACKIDILYSGLYRVGKDIPAGKYLITRTDEIEKNAHWIIHVFETEQAYKNRDRLAIQNLKTGEQACFFLDDGMILDVGTGYGTYMLCE